MSYLLSKQNIDISWPNDRKFYKKKVNYTDFSESEIQTFSLSDLEDVFFAFSLNNNKRDHELCRKITLEKYFSILNEKEQLLNKYKKYEEKENDGRGITIFNTLSQGVEFDIKTITRKIDFVKKYKHYGNHD